MGGQQVTAFSGENNRAILIYYKQSSPYNNLVEHFLKG